MRYVKLSMRTLPRVMYAVTFELKTFQSTSRENMYMEFMYMEKGDVWVEFEGMPRFTAKEGSLIVFPPDMHYTLDFLDKSKMHTCVNIALLLDGSVCQFVEEKEVRPEEYDRVVYFQNESLFFPLCDSFTVDESIFASMKKLTKIFKRNADYCNITCAALAVDILIAMSKRTYARLQASGQSMPSNVYYCKMVDEYLSEHFREPINLPIIARHVGLHPNYLSTIYRKQCGTTIMNRLLRIRLEEAKLLLRQNKYMIKEVAKLSGFSDFKYFNTVFSRYEGISPGRYVKTLFHEEEQSYLEFLDENKGLH